MGKMVVEKLQLIKYYHKRAIVSKSFPLVIEMNLKLGNFRCYLGEEGELQNNKDICHSGFKHHSRLPDCKYIACFTESKGQNLEVQRVSLPVNY